MLAVKFTPYAAMDIIDEIKFQIKANGAQLTWVAKKIGISRVYLTKILQRKMPLTDNVLNRLNQLWQARDDIKFHRDAKN